MTEESNPKKKRTVAAAGLIVGLIALTAAFLSPTIADAIDPPPPSIEETTVNLASRLIDAAKAKVTGQEYQPATVAPKLPSRFIYPVVVSIGMLAAALGVAALIRSENRTMAAGAIALGVGAAVVQWSIVIVGTILFVILVAAVVGTLTGGGL